MLGMEAFLWEREGPRKDWWFARFGLKISNPPVGGWL